MRDEVEEFAALLRALKDRTDRSYGSLARRVGMNTSTLHRYCTGEAVPRDFAPVERLAAFCRAAPDERLALHRLWLSAVAARQGTVPGGPPESGADADAHREASPEADGPATDTGTETGTGTDTNPDTAPGREPAATDSASSVTARPWYRGRGVLVSTAVACGLLATVLGSAALSDGHSPGTSPPLSAGSRTTAAPGVPHRSMTSSSKAPATSATTGSIAPTGTRGRPTTAAEPATVPPLAWATDPLVWDKGCDHDYVIDKPPSEVPPPPVEQDAGLWAATQHAVHGRHTLVRITVQGRSDTAVVLEALHVRIAGRDAPAAGNAYGMGQGCGGDLAPRRFAVDLDIDRPVARPQDGADVGRRLPAVRFPYRVSAEDPEVLLVDATTRAHDTRWYLELDWSCQGRTGTVRIDDHGRPFRTTGITGRPHYWYGRNDAGERAWVPDHPQP
ncbi:helix-turn-helix domain-containing protein [Streptomyces galbus]|uniref:Transcriptional regulator n=1 Tax=Streptomyces galbus TaxID=33898 RepID=A0A4U5WUI7_STRGB|nr:helix-turn-helix domain-containing protein [Streptomyces galbus]TKT06137.1 transcriptional regulator [Streptomyces galbus]GHD50869.1 transcriptional regulator [Streptomyces galbus]